MMVKYQSNPEPVVLDSRYSLPDSDRTSVDLELVGSYIMDYVSSTMSHL